MRASQSAEATDGLAPATAVSRRKQPICRVQSSVAERRELLVFDACLDVRAMGRAEWRLRRRRACLRANSHIGAVQPSERQGRLFREGAVDVVWPDRRLVQIATLRARRAH